MANLGSNGVAATTFSRSSGIVQSARKTSLSVAAMVCGIAAIHYFYMRGVWIETKSSPVVFRYVDWLLTVPLQIVEFYLILAAMTVVSVALFWRLLVASLVMLVFGFLGEVGMMDYWVGLQSEWLAGFTFSMKSLRVKPAR